MSCIWYEGIWYPHLLRRRGRGGSGTTPMISNTVDSTTFYFGRPLALFRLFTCCVAQEGTSISGDWGGGLDITSSLGAKFGARSSEIHQIGGKTWEVVTIRHKRWGKNPNFAVISEIQRAKFGVFVTYIFGGKILGCNKNFRGKFWGQDPYLLT